MNRSKFSVVIAAVLTVLFAVACNNPHLAGGKLHFDQERYEKAEENFQLAVEKVPTDGVAYMWLAMSQAEQGKVDEASANFAKAAELSPETAKDIEDNRNHYWADRMNSAKAYAEEAGNRTAEGDEDAAKEQYRLALEEFQKAAVYRPENTDSQLNIGKILFNLGEIDEALAVFDHVHEMAPDDESVNILLHGVYAGRGNDSFNKALEAKDVDDKETAAKMFGAALEFYSKAYEIDGGDIDLIQNMAAVRWELSEFVPDQQAALLEQAQLDYLAVLEQEPDNVDVLYNLSILYLETERHADALPLTEKLVDLDPKNSRWYAIQGRVQGGMDDKSAMIGNLLISQSLSSGEQVPLNQARTLAEENGPSSDLLGRYRESGEPEEIRVYTDNSGSKYVVWFYWSRGRAYCFQRGVETYIRKFAKYEDVEEAGSAGDD